MYCEKMCLQQKTWLSWTNVFFLTYSDNGVDLFILLLKPDCDLRHLMLTRTLSSFVVMTNDFDGQIDYLEQFGSSGVSICSITPTFSSYSFRDL